MYVCIYILFYSLSFFCAVHKCWFFSILSVMKKLLITITKREKKINGKKHIKSKRFIVNNAVRVVVTVTTGRSELLFESETEANEQKKTRTFYAFVFSFNSHSAIAYKPHFSLRILIRVPKWRGTNMSLTVAYHNNMYTCIFVLHGSNAQRPLNSNFLANGWKINGCLHSKSRIGQTHIYTMFICCSMVRENVCENRNLMHPSSHLYNAHEAFATNLQFMVDDSVIWCTEKDLFDLRKL